MLDTQDIVRALPLAVVSVPFFVIGHLMRSRGTQGVWLVHGVVDWSRVSEEGKKKAAAFGGVMAYLMGLLMLGCAAWLAAIPRSAAEWLGLTVTAPITAVVVVMILGVLRYAKRYPAPTANKHERR